MNKLLSLCIPTYGVTEWVVPVLDSIFNQNVDEEKYEIIVTDNGNNKEFETKMQEYLLAHKNLVYKKTTAYSFLNEIESYKLATGLFIKFINHRTILLPGTLEYLINFVNDNLEEKPFVYFSTGVLKFKNTKKFDNFDSFVKNLSYWSSWSTGMAFWKEDFEDLFNSEINYFNELFPHTDILFAKRDKKQYIIDNKNLFDEIQVDSSKKGKYDLYYAFSVEYIKIILDLLKTNDISIKTFKRIRGDNTWFIANLHLSYNFLKKKCSYDIDNYKKYIDVFYSRKQIFIKEICIFIKQILKKILFIK